MLTCKHDDEMVIRQSVGLGHAMTALITCLQNLYKLCVCYTDGAVLNHGTVSDMQLHLYLFWSGMKLKAQVGMSGYTSARLLHCMTGAAVTHPLLMQQSSHKDDCRFFWRVGNT